MLLNTTDTTVTHMLASKIYDFVFHNDTEILTASHLWISTGKQLFTDFMNNSLLLRSEVYILNKLLTVFKITIVMIINKIK